MYAGESYGASGAYMGSMSADNPITANGFTTPHAAAVIVIGSLLALVAIRRGFAGVSIGRVTGGLVKG